MIAAVSQAEEHLARHRSTIVFPAARLPAAIATAAEAAPILRGACAIPSPVEAGAYKRFILDFRTSPAILDYVDGAEVGRYSQAGVATPDHTLRTKNHPLVVPPPEPDRLDEFKAAVRGAVDRFVADYHAYFARHNPRQTISKRELDPMPRVILAPGLGLFGLGGSARDARIVADIAVSTVETVTDAEAAGRFDPVGEADMFDIEYWSLEQAKLGQAVEKIQQLETDLKTPITLGITAGANTTTASIGAITEAAESQVPVLGYTIPYALGNTLLTIWGAIIVALLA